MKRILTKSLLPLLLLTSINAKAIEVVKHEFSEKLILKIVRVIPDGFEEYSLSNHNGREMTLVCAKNRFHDNNPRAFIEYRNFLNEPAGQFIIESNKICLDMAKFIEQVHAAVDEQRPFIITLNKKTKLVEKIIYPNVDPLSDKGNINDLYLKKDILLTPKPTVKLD
jgi:hypothetical protein